jgi:hypothetical protein
MRVTGEGSEATPHHPISAYIVRPTGGTGKLAILSTNVDNEVDPKTDIQQTSRIWKGVPIFLGEQLGHEEV